MCLILRCWEPGRKGKKHNLATYYSTLPETNIGPENQRLEDELGWLIFRGELLGLIIGNISHNYATLL